MDRDRPRTRPLPDLRTDGGGGMSGIPEFDDEEAWKSMGVDTLIRLMQGRLDESYADVPPRPPFPIWGDVARNALMVVGSDILDRAADQAGCAKADDCQATAVFLTWLAWVIDDLAKDRLAGLT